MADKTKEEQDEKNKTESNQGKTEEGSKTTIKDGTGKENSIDKFPQEAQEAIKTLRGENAERRVFAKKLEEKHLKLEKELTEMKSGFSKALGLEGKDDLSPEEALKKLTFEKEEVKKENKKLKKDIELKEMVNKHGINPKMSDYFSYLLTSAKSILAEGENLPDHAVQDIVKKIKDLGGEPASVGVGGSIPNPTGEEGSGKTPQDITLDDFVRMNMAEKTQLYSLDKTRYTKLFQEALAKKKF